MSRFTFSRPSATARFSQHVGEGDVEGIVHFELFVRVQHFTEMTQDEIHAIVPSSPIAGSHSPRAVIVVQTVGADGEVHVVIVGNGTHQFQKGAA